MITFQVVLLILLVLRAVSVWLLLLFLSMLPLGKKVLHMEACNTIDLTLVHVLLLHRQNYHLQLVMTAFFDPMMVGEISHFHFFIFQMSAYLCTCLVVPGVSCSMLDF